MLRPLQTLRGNRDGVTFVEFALISPVLLIAMMGGLDLAFNAYTSTMLRGAVQDAARDATIETANTTALDTQVTNSVRNVLPSANLEFDRWSYASFSEIATPEDFDDLNGDGLCNDGEPFEDSNGNGVYDLDRAKAGDNGGARDVVVYSVTMSYDRLFPAPGLIGLPEEFSTTATTIVRNQPYDDMRPAPTTENCA